ncbi:MAG: hypothetical protein ACR2FS_05915 [Phormidesmis sp.]
MENLATETITSCPHTRRTLQIETGAAERTVRRWIKKAALTGQTIEGVERFTDEQRDLILSFRSTPKAEVIEAELMPEPGAITLRDTSEQATGLMRFDIQELELDAPVADLAALQAQTEQLEQAAQQGASSIAAYFGARFDVGLANIAAKQDNLLKGIEAQALNGAARSVANQQRGKQP